MDPNKVGNRSSENLTRRQKLLRRVGVPLAAVAAAGALYNNVSDDKDPGLKETFAEATTMVNVSTKFGGADSDWGHGAATSLIEEGVSKGVGNIAFDLDQDGEPDMSEKDTQEMLSEVPTYQQANELLEKAGYDDVLVDEGDVLEATIAVTADTDKNVSYEIVDAKITDIPNNQD